MWSRNRNNVASALTPVEQIVEIVQDVPNELRSLLRKMKVVLTNPGLQAGKRKQKSILSCFDKRKCQECQEAGGSWLRRQHSPVAAVAPIKSASCYAISCRSSMGHPVTPSSPGTCIIIRAGILMPNHLGLPSEARSAARRAMAIACPAMRAPLGAKSLFHG